MMIGKSQMALGVFLMSLMLMVGCGPSYFEGDITVEMAPEMKEPAQVYPSLEVDVVGVTASESSRWEAYSINDYFKPNNSLRQNALKLTLDFSNEKPGPEVIKYDGVKVRQTWEERKVDNLYVLVNLPGVWKDQPGDKDPRRLIIPFSEGRWDVDTIKIMIQSSGLNLLTQPEKEEE